MAKIDKYFSQPDQGSYAPPPPLQRKKKSSSAPIFIVIGGAVLLLVVILVVTQSGAPPAAPPPPPPAAGVALPDSQKREMYSSLMSLKGMLKATGNPSRSYQILAERYHIPIGTVYAVEAEGNNQHWPVE